MWRHNLTMAIRLMSICAAGSRVMRRIPLSPLYFLIVGAAALLIAWATVWVSTLHLARTSPVHALRYE